MVMGDNKSRLWITVCLTSCKYSTEIFLPCWSRTITPLPLRFPLDDYGNLLILNTSPKVGDTITATYADDAKYIDSRRELTEDTRRSTSRENCMGSQRVVGITRSAPLVELPNSMVIVMVVVLGMT